MAELNELAVIEKKTLTDIANAIRAKGGASEPMLPQEMPSRIMDIPSEDVKMPDYEKEVRFVRPDGVLLCSYSKDEIADDWTLPPQPEWGDYELRGWNMTREEIMARVEYYGYCDVGGVYSPENSLEIEIDLGGAEGSFSLHIGQTEANGVTVDWGDGSSDSLGATAGFVDIEHNYSVRKAKIKINANNGFVRLEGTGTSADDGLSIFGSRADFWRKVQVLSVAIGKNVAVGNDALRECRNLRCLVLSDSIGDVIPANFAQACRCMTALVLPRGITRINSGAFLDFVSARFVSLPEGITYFSSNSIDQASVCDRLTIPLSCETLGAQSCRSYQTARKMMLPPLVTTVPQYFVSDWTALVEVVLHDNIKRIDANGFRKMPSVKLLEFPTKLEYIGSKAFELCQSLETLDFSHADVIPTLASVDAFSGLAADYKIVVPSALYDRWIAETNWKDESIATHIVKASEYGA